MGRQPTTLKSAAAFLKTRRASPALTAALAKVASILNFPDERANRLVRFIEVVKAYSDGQPVAEIERDYGCTRSTVLRYARLMGLPKRPKHFDVNKRARVIRLYKLKRPIKEIAKRCGCSQALVSKIATEEGINRRVFQKRRR